MHYRLPNKRRQDTQFYVDAVDFGGKTIINFIIVSRSQVAK